MNGKTPYCMRTESQGKQYFEREGFHLSDAARKHRLMHEWIEGGKQGPAPSLASDGRAHKRTQLNALGGPPIPKGEGKPAAPKGGGGKKRKRSDKKGSGNFASQSISRQLDTPSSPRAQYQWIRPSQECSMPLSRVILRRRNGLPGMPIRSRPVQSLKIYSRLPVVLDRAPGEGRPGYKPLSEERAHINTT